MRVQGASVLTQVQTPDWEVPSASRPPHQRRTRTNSRCWPSACSPVISPPATRKLWPGCHPHSATSPRTASTSDHPSAPASRTGSRLSPRPTNRLGQKQVPPLLYRSSSWRRLAPAKILGIFAILAAAILAIILVSLNIGSQPVTTSPPVTAPPATSSPQTGASTGAETASAQAAQINSLLAASAATRNPLATALLDVKACNDVSGAIATIRAVAQRYGTEYGQATRLNTGQLPNGAALKNNMIDAYYLSATADYHFVEWAQYLEASHCVSSVPAAAAHNAGVADTAKATNSGDAFVQLWNPVAKSEGLPSRSGNDL